MRGLTARRSCWISTHTLSARKCGSWGSIGGDSGVGAHRDRQYLGYGTRSQAADWHRGKRSPAVMDWYSRRGYAALRSGSAGRAGRSDGNRAREDVALSPRRKRCATDDRRSRMTSSGNPPLWGRHAARRLRSLPGRPSPQSGCPQAQFAPGECRCSEPPEFRI